MTFHYVLMTLPWSGWQRLLSLKPGSTMTRFIEPHYSIQNDNMFLQANKIKIFLSILMYHNCNRTTVSTILHDISFYQLCLLFLQADNICPNSMTIIIRSILTADFILDKTVLCYGKYLLPIRGSRLMLYNWIPCWTIWQTI